MPRNRPVKNLNDLPDDCLLLIWKSCDLPLQKLIQLRRVCKRWQEIIVREICNRKRSLKLFGTMESDLITYCNFLLDYNLEMNDDYRLKPIGKDDDLVVRIDCEHNYLAHLFPKVENLIVYLTRFSSMMFNMPYLLNNLDNLTSLTLIYMPYPIDLQNQMWSAINSMSTLKHLNLFYIFQCTIPEEMPILKRLESFSLDGYYGDIVSVLPQLGPNLKSLHLDDIHCTIEQLQQALALNPGLKDTLTNLTIGSINIVKPILNNVKKRKIFDFICANFRSLKYLAFTWNATYTLDEIITGLDRLKKLEELHLPCFWHGSPRNCANLAQQTIQLTSVRTLQLAFAPSGDQIQEEFPKVELFKIFPNLDQLNIYGNRKLLDDAEQCLAHISKKGLCQVNLQEKCHDIGHYIGRHQDRYQKYLDELEKYDAGY